MRLLFLDFDGVLNSDAYFASPEHLAVTGGLSDAEVMLLDREHHLDPAKVALVNSLVERFELSVVISSSWRLQYSLDALNALLAKRGATFRAVDVTPRVTRYDPVRPLRAREILAYLERLSVPCEAVVVLDDDRLDGLVPGHVQVDGSVGFSAQQIDQCTELLRDA